MSSLLMLVLLGCLIFNPAVAQVGPSLEIEGWSQEQTKIIKDRVVRMSLKLTSCEFFRAGWPINHDYLTTHMVIAPPSFQPLPKTEENKKVCAMAHPFSNTIELDETKADIVCPKNAVMMHELLHIAGFAHGPEMAGILDTCLGPGAGNSARETFR